MPQIGLVLAMLLVCSALLLIYKDLELIAYPVMMIVGLSAMAMIVLEYRATLAMSDKDWLILALGGFLFIYAVKNFLKWALEPLREDITLEP